MHGSSSLRLQQPTKPVLKTYGSRNKRVSDTTSTTGSVNASKQFNWDRIENERKARLDRAKALPSTQNGLSHQSDTNTHRINRVPFSGTLPISEERWDINTESSVTHGSNSSYSNLKPRTTIPSTQESDPENNEHLSQTRLPKYTPIHSRNTLQTDEKYSFSSQDSALDSDLGSQARSRASNDNTTLSSIKQQESSRRDNPAILSKYGQPAEQTLHRRVMFQEKVFFEEESSENDDSADDDDGDEVLFRTPSFNVLQTLKERPKPQLPKPKVNPFGFDPVDSTESSHRSELVSRQSLEIPEGQISSEEITMTTSTTASKNPFLDSPTTKKSMEIINRRAQQIAEIQRLRKEKKEIESSKASSNTSMEVESNGHMDGHLRQGQEEPRSSSSSPRTRDSKHDNIRDGDNISSNKTRQYTPEPQDHDLDMRGDSLDISLGKRISSIEITPRRLLAKQRKTMNIESLPSLPSFRDSSDTDDTEETESLENRRLFLDRDVPKDGQDDLDILLDRARRNREFLASSSLMSGLSLSKNIKAIPPRSQLPHSEERRDQIFGSSMKSQLPELERASFSNKYGTSTHHYIDNQFNDPNNPFLVHESENKQETNTSVTLRQNTTKTLPPVLLDHPIDHRDQPNTAQETIQQKKPERKIRSLRRPPAVLVSSRKSVIRPTVDDLLAICDQKFFSQFKCLDTVTKEAKRSHVGANPVQAMRNRGIVDFDTLLPDFMVNSLSKIGEASYSEVYTVDLPVEQQRQGKVTDDNVFSLFESTKLNSYVQESMDEDHSRSKEIGYRKGKNPKLVLKVMPFYDDQSTTDEANQKIQERGRRSKGRRKATTTLLELEDIYREAMVSTQIMHGWKGFIGSFGTLVVKGKYPKAFLSVWDSFKKERGTESERPDVFTEEQLYCIILLPYGGIDLEHCPLENWCQAWSVLAQVAASLEPKEQAPYWFEHRDLHWGNILVKGTQQEHITFENRDKHSDTSNTGKREGRVVPTYGVVVQMIDFTLARVQGDKGNLIYMDLEKDQDLFQGQGDYQFEIYRKMRKVVGKDWAASRPGTNLLWLHYISDKLLTEKNLKKPTEKAAKGPSATKKYSRASIGPKEEELLEMWCYERIKSVSRMHLDRLDPSGRTPSGTVLELLFYNS